jgi:hypothetical protein
MQNTVKQPGDVFTRLRAQIFETSPASIGVTVEPGSTEPWGILMEIGYPKGVATLVSFASGDASLYFSGGGGVIGGIAHESVNHAAKRFVSMAQWYVGKMDIATSRPLPGPGKVRFYVLASQGVLTVETDEKDLGQKKNDLSPLFYAGHDVITELRLLCE